jgi:FkbM family methyltransferase
MTFISYAQNSEDVLLWRALGHVRNGFYIDVGANDPVEHSVTKAFYDAGWNGISVEPLPAYHAAFMEQRPRDVNLAIAAGAREGELTLYDVPAVRGWASPERAVAEAHKAEGYELAELTVPVRTLASICAEYVTGPIHFLKIDVEGFEGDVLQGMDFQRWRPWVLVIEATLPNSRDTNHGAWENLVTSQDYTFVWFDGLNRYYVAAEHPELLDAFGIQPNVFDDFISHHLDKAWAANKAAAKTTAKLDERLAQVSAAQQAAEHRAAESSALAREALAHANELLMRYDDANLRATREHEARMASESANALLQDELAARLAAWQAAQELAVSLMAERDALREQHDTVHGAYQALELRFDQLGADAHRTAMWANGLEQRVHAMEASNSWRITAPVRGVGSVARSLRRQGLARRILTRLTSNERLRRLLIPMLLRYPALNRRVSGTMAAIKQTAPVQPPEAVAVPAELQGLPASVRAVLADLQRAHGNHTGS